MRFNIATAAAAAATAATIALAAPAAAQEAPQLTHVFTITAEIDEAVDVGETVRGARRFIPITGGQVEGEGINGTVRGGAWDWQIDRPDGCTDLEADYFIETDDGALINVINRATICPPADGSRPPVFTSPSFEPPMGDYQWLGQGVFVGQLQMAENHPVPAVQIAIYRVE
ncbi:DUF3237 family protein [Aurantiacibacter rhizosphaerae]|uniref:UPF0311 protein GRF63_10095 n=1 Tax=Aurantiacibacter rhizosphaerae TaxID=2691582 RepID=A0A844XE11_9SPHN|nr:DUF3237 family protein [Aurantiacibacter rhizosphaerae]MWV28256.1 DUF3237 family protein [Aurantiacibacter rhizosphaerae]